jgi:ribonuclease E
MEAPNNKGTIMKKMLINANPEEWRTALIESNSNSLIDLDIEYRGHEQITANIYKGRVTRIEPSLEAAFIDYGGNRHGFLPIKEVAKEYYPAGSDEKTIDIKDVLRADQEIIVQVEKEERGTKGAALTTYITLAGSYLVLMPNNPSAGGISRRIDGEERDELREALDKTTIPEGMGLIVRTAGVGKSVEELQWDLDALVKVWDAIKASSDTGGKAPFLIHKESDAVIRAIRDYLRTDVDEIVVDDQEVFNRMKEYLERTRPEYANKITLYQSKVPLFSHYRVENQAETVFQREVRLPSGGAIVIDQTEALTAIDINSSRSTKGGDIEETALHTNLEAANEIARQLRLRDLGGLVIIDFIDMIPARNRRAVETQLRNALRRDRARVQIGSISRFGLLEMSRQRLRSSLRETRQLPCPRCHGQGTIRGIMSLTSSLLRLIEEKAGLDATAQVRIQVPADVATYLFNEKRPQLLEIETRHNITVQVLANPHFQVPHYEIRAVSVHEYATHAGEKSSYEMISDAQAENNMEAAADERSKAQRDAPAVKISLPDARPPKAKKRSGGLIQRIMKNLFGGEEEKPAEKTSTGTRSGSRQGNRRSSTGNRSRSGTGNRSRSGNRNNSGGNRSNSGNRRSSGTRGGNTRGTSTRSNPTSQNTDDNQNATSSNTTSASEEKPRSANGNRRSNAGNRSRSSDSRNNDDRSSDGRSRNSDGRRRNTRGPRRTSDSKPAAEKPATASNETKAASPAPSKPAAPAKPVTPIKAAIPKKAEAPKKPVVKAAPPPPKTKSSLDAAAPMKQVETAKKKED